MHKQLHPVLLSGDNLLVQQVPSPSGISSLFLSNANAGVILIDGPTIQMCVLLDAPGSDSYTAMVSAQQIKGFYGLWQGPGTIGASATLSGPGNCGQPNSIMLEVHSVSASGVDFTLNYPGGPLSALLPIGEACPTHPGC